MWLARAFRNANAYRRNRRGRLHRIARHRAIARRSRRVGDRSLWNTVAAARERSGERLARPHDVETRRSAASSPISRRSRSHHAAQHSVAISARIRSTTLKSRDRAAQRAQLRKNPAKKGIFASSGAPSAARAAADHGRHAEHPTRRTASRRWPANISALYKASRGSTLRRCVTKRLRSRQIPTERPA